MIFVYVTCKKREEARKIGKYLLKKKLIACYNIYAIESGYWWNKKIVDDNEFVLILKTDKSYDKIKKEVERMHSYKVPFIGSVNVSRLNKKYFDWMKTVM